MDLQIFNKIGTKFKPLGNKIKRHSPELLLGAGIIGTISSTVLACKATMKINDILQEKNEQMNKINEVYEEYKNGSEISYTEKDKDNDTKIVCTQTAVKLIKLYIPSIIVGGLSIGSILTGHKIMKKRNLALAAAYTMVDKGFKQYRKNVVDRYGEDVDKELRLGLKAKEVTKTITDENGKEKEVTETIYEMDDVTKYSPYARFFDESSKYFRKDPIDYNLMFLRQQQNYANDKLRIKGYLFLSDVYEMLGIAVTPVSRLVGWIYDPDKNDAGDNYVDFGIYDLTKEENKSFVNGTEHTILLDFNVDGVIQDKFEDYEYKHLY